MFELKMVKMLSYLLVFTISLILISTDIKKYEKPLPPKKTRNSNTENCGFTGLFYQDLVLDSIDSGGIFSLRAVFKKRCYFWIIYPKKQSWVYLIQFYFWRAGRKRLFWLLSHGPTTAKSCIFSN